MTRWIATLLASLVMLLAVAGTAAAQPDGTAKSPFGVAVPTGAANVPGAEPGLIGKAWSWVLSTQQKLHRDIAAAVKDLKAGGTVHAAWVLGLIAFLYGVLHAAGPGHGKAIISSYVLANERTVRRGISLSFLAAFFQALSAILIVGVLAILFNATSLTIKSTESWIETVSWALVALIGAWMLTGEVRKLIARRSPDADAAAHARGREHHHHGHHGHACTHSHHAGCGHDHGHEGHAAHADCCGHAHMPTPKDLEGDLPTRKALAIAASIGIRPCTGAILVLIFALSQGLLWAGVFATFAMAFGTALTTSALAALAVGSKELARRYAGEGSRLGEHIGTAAGLAGSFLVLAMGTAFFVSSLTTPAPL